MGGSFAPGRKQGLGDNANNPGLPQFAAIKPDRIPRSQAHFSTPGIQKWDDYMSHFDSRRIRKQNNHRRKSLHHLGGSFYT